MISTRSRGRLRRQRECEAPWAELPRLTSAQADLLRRWASGDAPTRRWRTLRELAGGDHLEAADALLERLVEHGCVAIEEQFRAGRWWPWQIGWVELPRLQQALGLQSLDERDARRQRCRELLANIAESTDVLRVAAEQLQAARASTPLMEARVELLQALARWIADQRSGVRQDFALFARPHTKAITEAEWHWLDTQLDLPALGVERFAQLLWLAGPMTLGSAQGRSSLGPWPFVGLPTEALVSLDRIDDAPTQYWLIENRASFERCARGRDADQCVVWVPGRPSSTWLKAMAQILACAPAPAQVSADTDPAGIEIALSVGALWAERELTWTTIAMETARLQAGKTLPLNEYDRATLRRILTSAELPDALRRLAEAIGEHGCKAEQEGWL